MGKSKSRILRKGINDQPVKISREEATSFAAEALNTGKNKQAQKYISMFFLTAEELLEAGANYESVVAINNILTL